MPNPEEGESYGGGLGSRAGGGGEEGTNVRGRASERMVSSVGTGPLRQWTGLPRSRCLKACGKEMSFSFNLNRIDAAAAAKAELARHWTGDSWCASFLFCGGGIAKIIWIRTAVLVF